MKSARVLIFFFSMTVVSVGLTAGGAKTPGDFPNRTEADGLAVGARLLNTDEVKQSFYSDVYRKYLVVEVAVEPVGGGPVSTLRSRFSLRAGGSDQAIAATAPGPAAETLRKDAESSKSIKLTPRSTAGYRTGDPRPPYQRDDPFEDPNDRRKGFYSRTGVDVTWGDPPPGSTPADQQVMETELDDKELPQGKLSKAVSGYLYFPKPDGKVGEFQFELQTSSGVVALALTP